MKEFSSLVQRLCICVALLLAMQVAFAQGRVITGKVTDPKTGSGVPDVSVVVKGTTIGTTTNSDGTYRIEVPQNATALSFSAVGFGEQEMTIGSSRTVNVALQTGAKSLDEVVVVGYGTQKRREVTSAVATVKAEDFNQGGSRSPVDLIQGKVAGLSITRAQGNNPNSGASIQLRGVTTLSLETAPLIVIDGIPGGNLDLLQQDDIESFDVLKDGSAAAIYGTRANGGVILITTKKGRGGDPKFDYSTYFQREAIAKRPEFLSADEFRSLVSANNDLGSNTNVYDMLIDKNNLSQYHNLAASGGTANTNYRASLFYNEANGIAILNGRKQYGGRLNINQKGLQGRLNAQLNLATNLNKANLLGGNNGDFEQALQRNPTAPILGADGKYIETNAYNNYNPLARLALELSERDQQTTSADVRFTLDVIKGLKLSAFGALVRNGWNDRSYRYRASRSSQVDYQGGGYASKSNFLSMDRTFESTIDYFKKINGVHSVNAIGGYSYQYSTSENFGVNTNGFITDAFLDWNLGSGNALTNILLPRPGISSSKQDNTLIAFFGRVSYAYDDKYMAQFVLRHEGSSRFGANNKWGNFPAVSVGWNISKEDFMSQIDAISNLKLRIGYGITGNQSIPNYQSLVTLGTGGMYLQDGLWFQTYGPGRNPNPNLRWEKKQELNVGLDFTLFKGRLGGSIDAYQRRTIDLLGNYTAQMPPFTLPTLYTNVGTISNKGIEVMVNAVTVRQKDFTWSTDVTWNTQRNKLVSLSNDVYKLDLLTFGDLPSPGALGPAIRTVEGGAIGNFYGKRFAGFNENGKWLFYKADKSTATADKINENDLGIIGNSVPKFMASWNNNFRYKNFDLTLFFRGKFGFDILNLKELYFGNKQWLPNNLLKSAIARHSQLNDAPQYSDYYLEKGDFVKLDNITLAYNFKLGTNYIRNLRVYASGRNLLTITGYSGLDPEMEDAGFVTGIDGRSFYPRTKSFTLGLNVGF